MLKRKALQLSDAVRTRSWHWPRTKRLRAPPLPLSLYPTITCAAAVMITPSCRARLALHQEARLILNTSHCTALSTLTLTLTAPWPHAYPIHHLQVPSRPRITTLNHKARLRLIRWNTTSYSQSPTTHLPPAVTWAVRWAESCQCAIFLVAYSSINIVRCGSAVPAYFEREWHREPPFEVTPCSDKLDNLRHPDWGALARQFFLVRLTDVFIFPYSTFARTFPSIYPLRPHRLHITGRMIPPVIHEAIGFLQNYHKTSIGHL